MHNNYRFYYPNILYNNIYIKLPKYIIYHYKLLRIKIKNKIILFNENNFEYTLYNINIKNKFYFKIKKYFLNNYELFFNIKLVQSLLNKHKMNFILEKATELGIKYIEPIITYNSFININKFKKKKKNWNNIIINSSQQNKRNFLVKILPVLNFFEWIKKKEINKIIMLSTNYNNKSFYEWIKNNKPQNISLLIGPEGGFKNIEEIYAKKKNIQILSLGKRILKTETVSIVIISILNFIWNKNII